MQTLTSDNDGFRYILTCIDVLSRYAWAVPVRSKSVKDMLIAVKRLFEIAHPRVPQRLQTDKGNEFFNKEVSALLRQKGIHHFASNSDKKAAVVERFNRTLKTRIWVYFTAHQTIRYVDVLDDIVNAYNHSVHRSIRMRPVDVNNEEAATKAWMSLYYKDSCTQRKPALAVGQHTRISRSKGEFEKGYMPNWGREHFVVRERLAYPHPVYKLEDTLGEPLEGYFYGKELQAIPKITLQVESVIRRRKRKNRKEVLVKWVGFDEKFNKWIPNKDLPKYQRTPAERAANKK